MQQTRPVTCVSTFAQGTDFIYVQVRRCTIKQGKACMCTGLGLTLYITVLALPPTVA